MSESPSASSAPSFARNGGAAVLYRRLGFVECGRLSAQVVIDGREDDEIVMEFFFTG